MTAIKIVAKAASDGRRGVSYSELGVALGRNPATAGRGLRPVLEAATTRCRQSNQPDIAPFVVQKETLDQAVPTPSKDVFDETGFWKSSGIYADDLADAQKKVRDFDWQQVKGLLG